MTVESRVFVFGWSRAVTAESRYCCPADLPLAFQALWPETAGSSGAALLSTDVAISRFSTPSLVSLRQKQKPGTYCYAPPWPQNPWICLLLSTLKGLLYVFAIQCPEIASGKNREKNIQAIILQYRHIPTFVSKIIDLKKNESPHVNKPTLS